METVNQKNNKKLSKILSTKLSIEDYDAFLTLTKLEYEAGLIKEQSPSELLRFTIRVSFLFTITRFLAKHKDYT